jgi:hypothetical protein
VSVSWLDRGEDPFASPWLDVGPGRLPDVDEGEGRPLVMVHGPPAEVVRLPDAGPARPEERGPEVTPVITPFLER